MLSRIKIAPIILFLLPIVISLGLFALTNSSCNIGGDGAAGTIKLLYTSEVGGRLDPCG